MKKIFSLVLGLMAFMGVASAQNYMVVDSEKIFKSIDEYNTAMTELDNLAKKYQAQVDSKFEEIENLYNNYQQQKVSLSAVARTAREQLILDAEAEAVKSRVDLRQRRSADEEAH